MRWHRSLLAVGCLTAGGFCASAQSGGVSAWTVRKDLTPENLIRSFAGFTFELNAQPQDPETFLQRQRGDCDDFADLASRLLADRGYKTKLVVVMMAQQTHVVCYVKEAHGYLDFNHRSDAHPIIESDGSLEDIAQKVAGDFRGKWLMASEFKFENKLPVYLEIVFPSIASSRKSAPAISQTADKRRETIHEVVSIRAASAGFTPKQAYGNRSP